MIGTFVQQKKGNKKITYGGADIDIVDSSDDDNEMDDQNMKVPKLFIDFIEERIDRRSFETSSRRRKVLENKILKEKDSIALQMFNRITSQK